MTTSVVVVTESQDHEFSNLHQAALFLSNHGYAQTDDHSEVETDIQGTLMTTTYERDQVGMEYDQDSSATLSIYAHADLPAVGAPPGLTADEHDLCIVYRYALSTGWSQAVAVSDMLRDLAIKEAPRSNFGRITP